jgi:hypothetical protein
MFDSGGLIEDEEHLVLWSIVDDWDEYVPGIKPLSCIVAEVAILSLGKLMRNRHGEPQRAYNKEIVNSVEGQEGTYRFKKKRAVLCIQIACLSRRNKRVKEGSKRYSIGVNRQATIVDMNCNES